MWYFVGFFLAVVLINCMRLQSVPVSEQRRRLSAMVENMEMQGVVTNTSFLTIGNPEITGTTSVTGVIFPGMEVSGTGIAPGSTVLFWNASTHAVTLSLAATSAGAEHITFTYVGTLDVQVHLFASPYGGGPDPAVSYFTTIEANFDGYAYESVTLDSPIYTTSSGGAETAMGQFNWTLSATPVVGNLIYGYWVDYIPADGPAGRVVSFWESFGSPVPMNLNANAVTLGIPLDIPNPGSAVLY